MLKLLTTLLIFQSQTAPLTKATSITQSPDTSETATKQGLDRPEKTTEGPEIEPGGTVTLPSSSDLPTFSSTGEPSFPSEELTLSDILKLSLEHNLDLRSRVIDVHISERNILAAIGAYDVFITANINGFLEETPQRGSAFVFSTGQRLLGGAVGFNRRLETGGRIELQIEFSRGLRNQPLSFFNAALGTTELAEYIIRPTLTLTHPLLQGAGIRVNRAEIERARLAKSQAEAEQMNIAQTVVRDVIQTYWEVLAAQRNLENKRHSVELVQEQLLRVRAEVSAGRRSPLDARSIEESLAQRENEALIAENTLFERGVALRTLIGQDLVKREVFGIIPTTNPQILRPRDIYLKREIDQALTAHPQIRQLQLALASRQIDELVTANQRLPTLDFQGSFSPQGRSIDRASDPELGTPGQEGSWAQAFRNFINDDVGKDGLLADWRISGSLTLTWDVQNRGPKANHQRAVLEIHRAETNLKIAQQNITSSVMRAVNSLRSAGKRMEVTGLSVKLAEENVAAEWARYQSGRSTSYDVRFQMDKLQLALEAELIAQIDYLRAQTELQMLTGELLPAYGLDLANYRSPY